jgi:polyisoprenoid-binding protein YceI
VTGHDQRDEYARDALLEVAKYPEIKFRIDSLVNPTRQADTLLASAMGVLSLHGVDKHLTAAVRAWPEAGGVRILGRFRVPAQAITREFGISNVKLGLGVGMKIWQDLFMGVDLLMRAPKGTGI